MADRSGANNQRNYAESNERSLGDLFTGLTTDLSTLLRQEVQLAKVETMENVSHAMQSIILLVAGGLIAYAGLLALIAAFVAGVAVLFSFSIWLSSLIVGVIVLGIGALLLQSGRGKLQQVNVVPAKTVSTMKDNVEMFKEKTA